MQTFETNPSSLYPQPDFNNLNKFLTFPESRSPVSSSDPDIEEHFITVHELSTGRSQSFLSTSDQRLTFASRAVNDVPVLVFLRGFASPSWLKAVQARYGACPEFYRRHLDLKAFDFIGRDYYTSPGLPSSSSRVFQLSIPTLWSKDVELSVEPDDLQEPRRSHLNKMRAYFTYLPLKSSVADSIIRNHVPLDKSTDLLEQKVTVEVARLGSTWRALVWLDSGRDLSTSGEGLWWKPEPTVKWWQNYLIPVINHLEWEAPEAPTREAPDPSSMIGSQYQSAKPDRGGNQRWSKDQNARVLPFQYGRNLDKTLASRNAMYALSELFQFAASAQLQLLNKLQRLLEREISFVGIAGDSKWRSRSLVNLKYIKAHLGSYTSSLLETVTMLENSDFLDWPSEDKEDPRVRKTSAMVLVNYRYLHDRARKLGSEVEQGMTTLVNASALENATRVQRLTVLATVFIPLSYVSAVWGMNFKEIGSGTRSMWWWVVTSVPVLGLSLLIYYLQRVRDLISSRDNHLVDPFKII